MNPAPSRGHHEFPDNGPAQPAPRSLPSKATPQMADSRVAPCPTGLAQEILGRLPIAVAVFDGDLRLRWAALPAGRAPGIDVRSLAGRPVAELLGSRVGAALAALTSVLSTGQRLSAEAVPVVWPDEDAPSFWDLDLEPLTDRGEIVGVVAFAREASNRVERDGQMRDRIRQLEEKSALQADFLSVASHELRAPLTSLVGYAELLEENLADVLSEDQANFVRHLHDNALRLQRIVDDILDFTRYETGTFHLALQAVDMREIVQDALDCLERQLQAAGIELDWVPPTDPVSLTADAVRLGQVLLNFLSNALKFTARGGRITVTVKNVGGKVRVEVRDTGIGISRSHLSKLFDKFYQVNPKRADRKGIGLGLAICKTLVEAHGGQIGVRSRPGRGSTFWFTVPVDGPVAWQSERQLKLFA